MKSSQYNFVSFTRTYNVVEAVVTTIAFCFNRTLTVYYFTNVRIYDNSFSSHAYSIIPICSVFYVLTWYLKREINGVTLIGNRTDFMNKISLLGQPSFAWMHT
jgi:hypothetical protein